MAEDKSIGIILISQDQVARIRDDVDVHIFNNLFPTIIEIPSKSKPYEVSKDLMMKKVAKSLYGANYKLEGRLYIGTIQ